MINTCLEKLSKFGEEISEIARGLGKETSVEELVARASSNHLEVLAEVYEKVPETARPAIEKVISTSIRNRERAVEALKAKGALGEIPEEFEYEGENYTATSFHDRLGIDADDYVMITSFSHVPFYEAVILEIPDNWSWKESYNIPLDELVQIVDSAIYKGYSVAWASDVSEDGFSFKKGLAVAPEILYSSHSRREEAKWAEKTDDEKDDQKREAGQINEFYRARYPGEFQ